MRFRRHWGLFWQEAVIVPWCTGLGVALDVYFYRSGEWRWPIFSLGFFLLLAFGFLVFHLGTHASWSDIIELGDTGIALYSQKQEDVFIPWNQIKKVVPSNNIVANILIIISEEGDLIWFYNSRRIRKYIISVFPDIVNLYSKELNWQEKRLYMMDRYYYEKPKSKKAPSRHDDNEAE